MKLFYENDSKRFLFQTSNNLTFPSHIHGGLELFLLVDGELQVTVGNQIKLLTQGDACLIFPNQIHSYETNSHGFSNGILILCPAETGGDFLSTLLTSHPVCPFMNKDRLHPDITYAFHSLMQTRPDRTDNIPVIRAFIQLILARLLPDTELVKNKDTHLLNLTTKLISYLSDHYTEPITLDVLSAQLNVSKYTISRVFSEKLHMNFSFYLNTLRIDYAKLLLLSSEYDILTISMMCGYENPRTFNREFRALCGCQPRSYRKKQR